MKKVIIKYWDWAMLLIVLVFCCVSLFYSCSYRKEKKSMCEKMGGKTAFATHYGKESYIWNRKAICVKEEYNIE